MNLTIFKNFSKRRNSTKQPTGGTSVTVYLKDGCSVENPVFRIDGVDLSANYCFWDGNYYFIDDIVLSNNNIYELHCSIDVLATYKTTIGSSTQFIERSASDFDKLIPDPLLSQSQNVVSANYATTTISKLNTAGFYTIQCFGTHGVNIFGYDDLKNITGILNNSAYGFTPGGFDALFQTIGMNVMDVSAYCSNVMWHPFNMSNFVTTANCPIAVAFWVLTGVTGTRMDTHYITDSGTINIPTTHYPSDDFRSYHPAYSRYELYLPGVGTVSMPAVNASAELYYSMTYDIITGECTYALYSRLQGGLQQAKIATYSGMLGVSIPWSTQRIDAPSLLEHIVAPDISFQDYASIANSTVHAAMNVVRDTIEPQTSIHAGGGNMANIKTHSAIVCSVQNFDCKDFPLTECGRPLFEHRTISTLSGFIKCSNASVSITGLGPEKDMVNNYLNTGFYYE